MTLSDARRQLSATHQLALRCVADGDDDLSAAERLGVPFGSLNAVVAEAGAALHRLLTEAAEPETTEPGRLRSGGERDTEMSRGLPMPIAPASGHVKATNLAL